MVVAAKLLLCGKVSVAALRANFMTSELSVLMAEAQISWAAVSTFDPVVGGLLLALFLRWRYPWRCYSSLSWLVSFFLCLDPLP